MQKFSVSQPVLRTVCWRCQIRQRASSSTSTRSFSVSQTRAAEDDGPDRKQRSRAAFDQISQFTNRPSNRGGAAPVSGFSRGASSRGGGFSRGRGAARGRGGGFSRDNDDRRSNFSVDRFDSGQSFQRSARGRGGGRGRGRGGRGGRGGAGGDRPRDANNPARRGATEAEGDEGQQNDGSDVFDPEEPLLAPTNYDVLVDEDEADFMNLEEAKHYGQAMDFIDSYYAKHGHPIEREGDKGKAAREARNSAIEEEEEHGEHSPQHMREVLRLSPMLVYYDYDAMSKAELRQTFMDDVLSEPPEGSPSDIKELHKQLSEYPLDDMREHLIRQKYCDQIFFGEGHENIPTSEMHDRLKAGVMLVPRRDFTDVAKKVDRMDEDEVHDAFEQHITDTELDIDVEPMRQALKDGGFKHKEDIYDVEGMDDKQVAQAFNAWNAWEQPKHDPQADLEVRDVLNHIIETDERHLPRHRPGHSRQAIAERGAIGDVGTGPQGAGNLLEDDLRYLSKRRGLEWQDPKELALRLIQGEMVRFRDLPERREVLKLAEEMAYRPDQEEGTSNVGFEAPEGTARQELVKRLVGGKYEDLADKGIKGGYAKGVARLVNGNASYPAAAKQMMLKTIMELMPEQGRPGVAKRENLV